MVREVAVDILLALAVAVVLASSLGVLVMRDAVRKVHYLGPLSVVAPVLVGLAVLVQSGWSSRSAQTWLAVLLVVTASPYLSHATIRAARIRTRGDWRQSGPQADADHGGKP